MQRKSPRDDQVDYSLAQYPRLVDFPLFLRGLS